MLKDFIENDSEIKDIIDSALDATDLSDEEKQNIRDAVKSTFRHIDDDEDFENKKRTKDERIQKIREIYKDILTRCKERILGSPIVNDLSERQIRRIKNVTYQKEK